MMEENLLSILRQNSALTSLVGTSIDWTQRTQGRSMPGVTLQIISGRKTQTMKGPCDLLEGVVQVNCYGKTYSESKSIARAIEDQLNGFSGFDFQGIFLDDVRDLYVSGSNEPEETFFVSMDFSFYFED